MNHHGHACPDFSKHLKCLHLAQLPQKVIFKILKYAHGYYINVVVFFWER